MNKGRFKTLAIATLSAIALAASIAVAQTVTTPQDNQQGVRPEWRGRRGDHKGHGMGGMRAGGFFIVVARWLATRDTARPRLMPTLPR